MSVSSICMRALACIALVTILFCSCKKGDTGPAGPAGTANVIYSDWFTTSPWIKDTVFGIWGYKYNKAAPDITQKVLDSGTVITFGKLLGYNVSIWPTDQVSQMPISLTYVQGVTMTDTWSALASPGNLRIRFVNDKNYWTSIATSHQFRYIIIPGGKKTGVTALKQGEVTGSAKQISSNDLSEVRNNFQNMSYAEVCQRLNVPE